MTKLTTAILCGGVSPEHEVSMNSARNIYKAIDKAKYDVVVIGVSRSGQWLHLPEDEFLSLTSIETGNNGWPLMLLPGEEQVVQYRPLASPPFGGQGGLQFPNIDVVFPIIHGPFGEDGTLQGLLALLGLPFVGANTLGASVGMDKDFTKRLLRDAGILVAPWVMLRKHETPDYQAIAEQLGYPMFIKPANMGSSVGVSKAEDLEELKTAIATAFKFDTKILVEEGLKGREIETAVLGNIENLQVSGVGEIVMEKGFYDYESKYISPDAAKVVIPAENVSPADVENIRETALRAFQVLGLEGLARMDVFLLDDGQVFVNEPNTLPGFTNISMYPKLWMQAGVSYPDLIDHLLTLAIERHQRDGALQRTRF
ncbi:MAG: D-alanine--D-alanine ligase [Saprospiraceae bacterium]|nr:D-alanine--D-alanine ligase [Saprospiraceae bacterium]MCF8252708.1 D-alanine--D-alanine ligase [Saprospiraceae bacterium]MCF8282932.1 D-alanine--D-alanine ligase [Bacteroidales bacterium]MCF8311644.1 D-alanine--D-alanine ligase [Saprospiraceae bacterium]MCF8440985.1 D-alanine--D-alanine ligase [Saprospiraceae bacterium]